MKNRRKTLIGALGLVALGTALFFSGVFGASPGFAADPGERSVTLTYDPLTGQVVGKFQTTASVDVFVTTSGSGGPVLWGESLLETDPSGSVGHDATADLPGTQYNFTVTWHDALQMQTFQLMAVASKP